MQFVEVTVAFLSMENLHDVTKFRLTRRAKRTIKKIISVEVYMIDGRYDYMRSN